MGIGTFNGRRERCFVRSYQSCRLYIYRVVLQVKDVWCSVVRICLVHVANVILYIGVYSREFIHIKRFRVTCDASQYPRRSARCCQHKVCRLVVGMFAVVLVLHFLGMICLDTLLMDYF